MRDRLIRKLLIKKGKITKKEDALEFHKWIAEAKEQEKTRQTRAALALVNNLEPLMLKIMSSWVYAKIVFNGIEGIEKGKDIYETIWNCCYLDVENLAGVLGLGGYERKQCYKALYKLHGHKAIYPDNSLSPVAESIVKKKGGELLRELGLVK